MTNATFSLEEETLQELRSTIPKRKISHFVNKVLKKEINLTKRERLLQKIKHNWNKSKNKNWGTSKETAQTIREMRESR